MYRPRFAATLAAELPQPAFARVLELVRIDVENLSAELVRCHARADQAALRRAAHTLAGVAGQVEAAALEQACRNAMAGEADLPAILRLSEDVLASIAAEGGVAP